MLLPVVALVAAALPASLHAAMHRYDMLAFADFKQPSHRLLHATSRQLYIDRAQTGDQFGLALASLGDIDDDGYSEFAVASNRPNTPCSHINIIRVTAHARADLLSVQPLCNNNPADNHYAALSLVSQHQRKKQGKRLTLLAAGVPDHGNAGAVQISSLDPRGTLQAPQHVLDVTDIPLGSQFGASLTSLGDLNGDGNNDILVGAPGHSSLYVIFLNATGHAVHSLRHHFSTEPQFGRSMTTLGDINDDTVIEVLVSSARAVHLLRLSTQGEISENLSLDLPPATTRAAGRGNSLGFVGFDDSDNPTFAIGNRFDNDGGTLKGAIWVAAIDRKGHVVRCEKYSETQGNLDGKLETGDHFGASVATALDVNKDGFAELLVGVPRPPTGPHMVDSGALNHPGKPGMLWILDIPSTKSVRTARMEEIAPSSECVFNTEQCTCLFRQRPRSLCLALAEVTTEGQLCHERYCASAFECDCRGTDICTIEHVSKTVLEAAKHKPIAGARLIQRGDSTLIPCEEVTFNSTFLTVHR